MWRRPRGTPRVGEGTGSAGSCPFKGIRERCAPSPCARARGISRGWTRSGQGHPLPTARGSQEQPGAHGGAHGTPCGHSPGSARSDLSPDYGFLWIRRQEKQSLVLPGDAPSLHPPDPPVPPKFRRVPHSGMRFPDSSQGQTQSRGAPSGTSHHPPGPAPLPLPFPSARRNKIPILLKH